MADAHNVQISARIRPFTEAERDEGAYNIIGIDRDARTVEVNEQRDSGPVKVMFDEVFNSHNERAPDFASQRDVFETVAVPLLDLAFEGFNVSLLGFGQTGSGKTHTMVGDNRQRGIVPMFVAEVFSRIAQHRKEVQGCIWRVELDALEVYNERIYNLLEGCTTEDGLNDDVPKVLRTTRGGASARSRTPGTPKSTRRGAAPPSPSRPRGTARSRSRSRDLRPGEDNPTYILAGGTHVPYYVKGLQPIVITDVNKAFALLGIAERARTTAETRMNRQSSRAHVLYRIKLQRREGKRVLSSMVSLVDLAGSENVKRSGAEGVVMQEAISINKSLHVLSHCLSLRAAKSTQISPPYNTSTLTKLLKETLSGNARTHIVIALSPSNLNAVASVTALRFAKMCKQVRVKPKKNLTSDDKYAEQLRLTIDEMKAQLQAKDEVNQELKDKIAELEEWINEDKRREERAGGPSQVALQRFLTEQESTLLKIEEAYFGEEEKFPNTTEGIRAARAYYQRLADREESKGDDFTLELIDPESEEDQEVYNILATIFQWSCTNYASEFLLHRLQLQVTRIERVINSPLRSQFYSTKSGLRGPNLPSLLRFYGSKCSDVSSVLRRGFRRPDEREFHQFGSALYFAANATKAALSTTEMENQLMVCEVAAGVTMEPHHLLRTNTHQLTSDWVSEQACDSVYLTRGASLLHDEHLVFLDHQAIPVYLITYTIGESSRQQKRLANLESINKALEEKVREHELTIQSLQANNEALVNCLPTELPITPSSPPSLPPPPPPPPAAVMASMGTGTDPIPVFADMATEPTPSKKKKSKCTVM